MANIIICADGTWNKPEEDVSTDFPTNILKTARAITPHHNGINQHVFYDWGLGSYHSGITAGISGKGIHKNILDGYRYIVQNYSNGDNIYLFGFSRGAYTVRALSGLINNCGILKRENARLISSAWKIFKNPSTENHPKGENAKSFREEFCHDSNTIHFIGVYDTVGSLGIPFSLMGLFDADDEFYDTKMGSNISVSRHALAIDEERKDFEPTVWTPRSSVDLKQVWFAGSHSDVGGSYPPDENKNLVSDVPLFWILNEAKHAGLNIEPYIINSLSKGRDRGKLNKSKKHIFRLRSSIHRELIIKDKPTFIHISVKNRYQSDENYRPPQLKKLVENEGWENLEIEG